MMQLEKERVLDLIRARGDTELAERARRELPNLVDLDRDAELLRTFGVDPRTLRGTLGGKVGF